ncbi:hypothetical protein NOM01_04610 [Sporolactobacillus sp. STSJ-5]|uniref:hypothetical protein n=1 Tax=Sporolactobacillus sp. STSJ-5 TaxID=2965076 RepID=UPI0021025480|nr:hypothetical protein [Sporolactobacillus sp. STSJ-5]MCQ2009276.1 hypothetical protein [Sporolactobacillus sp. STSJ-5]
MSAALLMTDNNGKDVINNFFHIPTKQRAYFKLKKEEQEGIEDIIDKIKNEIHQDGDINKDNSI